MMDNYMNIHKMILVPVLSVTIAAMVLHSSNHTFASNSSVLLPPESQSNGIFDNVFDIFGGRPFEHLVEIDANEIFPNESLKHEIVSTSGSFEFTIPILSYDLLGFNISASDIKVSTNTKQIVYDENQRNNTRIDFPIMLAKNVSVSNEIVSQKYENVDLSSIYALYDPETDKFTFHIPFEIAARYIINGS
jgi:hypothetical protein